jgi:hypothetical protein
LHGSPGGSEYLGDAAPKTWRALPVAGTFVGLSPPTGRLLTGAQIIQDLDKRGKIVSFTFQKSQAFQAISAGVHLVAELNIFQHALDKRNSGFHGHLLTGFSAWRSQDLNFKAPATLPRQTPGGISLIKRRSVGGKMQLGERLGPMGALKRKGVTA